MKTLYSSFILLFFLQACTKAQPTFNFQGFSYKQINAQLHILKSDRYNTNVGIFIDTNGITLIDPMIGDNRHEELLKVIKQLSDKPIQYVINTHGHLDHSGANSFFANQGATIIGHENCHYAKTVVDVTFKDSYLLKLATETIQLVYAPAHTFDGAFVYFEKADALFMGDVFMTNWYPFFHHGGGSKNG